MAEEKTETRTLDLRDILNLPADEVSLERTLHQLCDDSIERKEKSGDLDGCRDIFNVWIASRPPLSVWLSYIYFELRHGDADKARWIFEALVEHLPDPTSWVHYAEFEFNYGSKVGVRICRDRAMFSLKKDAGNGLIDLILAFAKFEEQSNELENAARLYQSALNNCIDSIYQFNFIFQKILDFGKWQGEKKRRFVVKKLLSDQRDDFEAFVKKKPLNYNAWWNYIHLEEAIGDENSIRLLYKRALGNVPKIQEKSYWKKYVYLVILYALFEEIDAGDIYRARQAYIDCIKLIPHEKFSFTKIWLFAAMFELKQLKVENMRKILDFAIKIAPKEKILRKYLHMEEILGNVQQCRMIHTKLVQFSPDDSYKPWIEAAKFEMANNETKRARFIFQLAVSQPALQNSEKLWKAYTDFEISIGETLYPRDLHDGILSQNKNHINVWISYARFEAYGVQKILMEKGVRPDKCVRLRSVCLNRARDVFYDGMECNGCFDQYTSNTSDELEKKQNMIVIEWVEMERRFGDLGDYGEFYSKLHWGLRMKVKNMVSFYNDDDELLHYTPEDGDIDMDSWGGLSDVELD